MTRPRIGWMSIVILAMLAAVLQPAARAFAANVKTDLPSTAITYEDPICCGTSSGNLANGGYAARSEGKTFVLLRGENDLAGDMRTRIGVIEGASHKARIIHTMQDTNDHGRNWIEGLQVVEYAIVFAEMHEDTMGGAHTSCTIMRMSGNGDSKHALVTIDDVGDQAGYAAGGFWIDEGALYYIDKGVLYVQHFERDGSSEYTHDLTERQTVARIDGNALVAVDGGVVYYTDGARKHVYAATSGKDNIPVLDTLDADVLGNASLQVSSLYARNGKAVCALGNESGGTGIEVVVIKDAESRLSQSHLAYTSKDGRIQNAVTSLNEYGRDDLYVADGGGNTIKLYKHDYAQGDKGYALREWLTINDASLEQGVCIAGSRIYYENGKGELCSIGVNGKDEHVITAYYYDPYKDKKEKPLFKLYHNNNEARHGLTIALSNFSETGLGIAHGDRYSFDVETSPIDDWAYLAFNNYRINGGEVESVNSSAKSPLPGNERVSVEQMDKTAEHLCGRTVDWTKATDYRDGYVYESITDGFRTYGPVFIRESHENPDGTLAVSFDAYYQDDKETHYKIGNGDQYDMSILELNNLLGVEGPNARGYATLHYEYSGGAWSFKVLSYDIVMKREQ